MTRELFSTNKMKLLFEKLASFSSQPNNKGVTRIAYTPTDQAAHQYMMETMQQAGFIVRQDAIGNIFCRLPGKNPDLPAVGTGSHLDTVPDGGAYDGTLGVVAGFYALMQFQPQQLSRDLELIVFRAEESSRFGFSCIGSKVLLGAVDNEKWALNLDDNGQNFFEVIDECGYNSQQIEQCKLPDDYFSAFIELHIEQGRRLELEEKNVGIVNGIAAPTRYSVKVTGHADHSGATPMYQRHDALVASAAIIDDLNRAACKEAVWGTVGTIGKLNVYPNSMNVIPGEVNFLVDIRGIEPESIRRVADHLKDSIKKSEHDNEVSINIREISSENPVKLDNEICHVIEQHCIEKQLKYMTMLSGAGHDSMNMAKKFPTAMIFTPSKDGISHHPDEFTDFNDIIIAADLLKETLYSLAK
ncbi:M20 family metallo-hydrolase [Providencia rustigianii]|uniref:M20 family metallo-hydrolase n=1 Tax=Providencia rustigianii TaxID=158850 RepID=UPI0022448F86|nr:M20 family metallo-hydrolase [Providencia rustigianii]